jgi:sporulation protein YlmC with PRC-barrel domain
MARITSAAIAAILGMLLTTTVASAQSSQPGPVAQTLSIIPKDSVTVTHWYKQNVYDPSDKKIGEIMDVLVDREGKATALIISVGGFLGAGSKDVAIPFNAVHTTNKGNNKWYLVMNADKDSLKNAKGFKYDRNAMAWMPEETPATTGSPAAPAPRPSNR